MIGDELHDAVRIVDIDSAEAISIVPVPDLLESLRMSVIGQDPLHLFLRESEPLVRIRGEHRVHLDIVEIGKDALLRNLHDAGDIGHLKTLVAFDRGLHEVSKKVHHRTMGCFSERVGYGAVVFVDEHHDLPPVMAMQHSREFLDRETQHGPTHRPFGERIE